MWPCRAASPLCQATAKAEDTVFSLPCHDRQRRKGRSTHVLQRRGKKGERGMRAVIASRWVPFFPVSSAVSSQVEWALYAWAPRYGGEEGFFSYLVTRVAFAIRKLKQRFPVWFVPCACRGEVCWHARWRCLGQRRRFSACRCHHRSRRLPLVRDEKLLWVVQL